MSWQHESCLQCKPCADNKAHYCEKLLGAGYNTHGGFASKINLQQQFVFPLPEAISNAEATVFNAIQRSELKEGMKVAVIGIGGLGHMAIQFLKAMNCQIIAFSTCEDKRKESLELGANEFVLMQKGEEAKLYHEQFDIIFSTTAASLNYGPYLSSLRPEGSLCIIGMPSENIIISVLPLIFAQVRNAAMRQSRIILINPWIAPPPLAMTGTGESRILLRSSQSIVLICRTFYKHRIVGRPK